MTLRDEIDALPVVTRRAMLRAIQSDLPLMGGTWSRNRAPCPLLAAHRFGGRCQQSIRSHFPMALDVFMGVDYDSARLLTEGERGELDNLLTQSLAREYEPVLEAVA